MDLVLCICELYSISECIITYLSLFSYHYICFPINMSYFYACVSFTFASFFIS